MVMSNSVTLASPKISGSHLVRLAVEYLRQSTMKQVYEHQESTARQYGLCRRAEELGWPTDRVLVIDEDLGLSGTSTEGRAGFKRLAEDVSRGRVGTIFALEVSRLARSSADWHRLLDLCGWADVLIADEQGVYSPNDPNDRLLLGLKGQMSEAERYWMRLRLHGARLSKARRGALRVSAPTGYVWDETAGRLRLDPDERIQHMVRLIFERFRIDQSAGAVSRYLVEQGLTIPTRQPGGEVVSKRPYRSLVLVLLHNPIYAGAYVYGRRESRTAFVDGELRRGHVRNLPRAEWKVCLPDQHVGYISWEEFLSNQDTLDGNRNRRRPPGSPGPARQSQALLQGLVLCGRCGAHMSVQQGGAAAARYICTAPLQNGTGAKVCWSVAASAIDGRVGEQFLEVATPPQLELSLAVTREVERRAGELEHQWTLRLERARYEARLAERRYMAVDPDNRVVARTLERDWEEKLRAVESLETAYEQARRTHRVELSASDRKEILELASNLPRVWHAATTTPVQRKNLLRVLIEVVTLTPIDVPRRTTRVQLQWCTGAITDMLVERPLTNPVHAAPAEAVEQIRVGVDRRLSDEEIATRLNAAGMTTASGAPWTAGGVGGVRKRRGLHSPYKPGTGRRVPPVGPDGLLSTRCLAQRFGVTESQVRRWVGSGAIQPAERGGRAPLWFRLDEELERVMTVLAQQGPGSRREP